MNIPHAHPEDGQSLLALAAAKGGVRLAASTAGLLALVLLAIVAFPARTVNADSLASENLEPTELVLMSGSIQIGEFAEFAEFDWGGGTLRQLLDRLLLEGCTINHISNLLWRWVPNNNDPWQRYKPQTAYERASQASQAIPNTISIGMLDSVPRGRYFVRCIAGCGAYLDENYLPLASIVDCPTQLDNLAPSKVHEDVYNFIHATFGENDLSLPKLESPDPDTIRNGGDLCWELNDSRIKDWRSDLVTPYLAIHPGTCLLREADDLTLAETAWGFLYPPSLKAPPVVVLIDTTDNTVSSAITENDDALALIVHEYCHANQYWHIQRAWQFPTVDSLPKYIAEWRASWGTARWWANATPAGRAFTKAVGMFWSNGRWIVNDPPFNIMYRIDPMELAAEVCTEHFAKLLEIDSRYAWWTVDEKRTPTLRSEGRIDWDPAEVLTESIARWLDDYILLPHVDPRRGSLGPCQVDEPIREGQSCSIMHADQDTGQPFIVPKGKNGAAWSPCDLLGEAHVLNTDRIKVDVIDRGDGKGDCGVLPPGWTFQAERVHDAWYIRAVGQWVDRGPCRVDPSPPSFLVKPGEYCTVPFLHTSASDLRPAQFRVYAVDELNESDTNPINPADRRDLYSHRGYAVLYHWPARATGGLEKPSAANNRLHHGCVQYPPVSEGRPIEFKAEKQRRDGAWKIIDTENFTDCVESTDSDESPATVAEDGEVIIINTEKRQEDQTIDGEDDGVTVIVEDDGDDEATVTIEGLD